MVALLAKMDLLGLLSRRLIAAGFARESLQEIKVVETLPALTVGMFRRADTPLTRASAAMARALTAIARRLADST